MGLKLLSWFVVLLTVVSFAAADSDFRNVFAIHWRGNACDNLAYAKQMGYDYVMYQSSMERCPVELRRNMHFYFENPDASAATSKFNIWNIDVTKAYSDAQAEAYSSFYTWKGSATEQTPFPDNLATGWWFTNVTYRPLTDFQQQALIDFTVNYALDAVQKLENQSIGWLFGGWAWDGGTDFKGDWSTERHSGYTGTNWICGNHVCNGRFVTLAFWNPDNIQSGALHSGITHEYATFPDAKIAFYKQLFSETEKLFPGFNIYYEPYNVYTDEIKLLENRADKLELMPVNRVFLCQESGDNSVDDLLFITNSKIYASGLITKEYVCSSTPDTHDHARNLAIAATAAINGAWTTFFGRWGGTDGTPNYNGVSEVPNRLKLIRLLPNWDNKQHIPLEDRHWNLTSKVYQSLNSYADLGIVYSRHPVTGELYVVFLDQSSFVRLKPNESVSEAWSTDGSFAKVGKADGQFTVIDQKIYLASAEVGKGYIFKLGQAKIEEIPVQNETCSSCVEDENETVPAVPDPVPAPVPVQSTLAKQYAQFRLDTESQDVKNIRDLIIKSSGVQVDFTGQAIDLTGFNESAVIIKDHFIGVDSAKFPALNRPAWLSFTGVMPSYVILKNNAPCGLPACSFVQYDGSSRILNFRVSGFSNYSINYTGYIPTYNKVDLNAIVIDAVGTAGASFVSVTDLVILGLILLLIVNLVGRWKR